MKAEERFAAGPVLLRKALPQEDVFLLQVYASTRADELGLVDWSDEQKQRFIEMQFQAQRQHYLVHFPAAEYSLICDGDQRPIGRLIVERSGGEIRLMDIALLPEARNAGMGTRILQALQEEASVKRVPVRLHVELHNRARRLYERLGFVVCGDADAGLYLEMEWRPPGWEPAPSQEPETQTPPASLSKVFFAARLKSRFRLRSDAGETLELELIELQEGPASPRLEQFSILFREAGHSLLPQKIYRLEAGPGEVLDLFLVPVGRDEAGVYYEAVINRLIPTQEDKG